MRWRDFDNLTPLPDTFFAQPRRVHFIGIGGIGMSALAFVLLSRGHHVSGSDANDSAMLARLREAGATTFVGHDASQLGGAEAIVWNTAIAPTNPEMLAAEAAGLPRWHRGQLLAYFVNTAKYSIAVSGTHGKSTTSAMVAHIMERAGVNPTAILGAEYPPFGSNARIGDPDFVVVEADESDGSFTLLRPNVAVITNVEPEHLENYDDSEEELWRAFKQFATQAELLVLNVDSPTVRKQLVTDKTITYETGDEWQDSVLWASNITANNGRLYFDFAYHSFYDEATDRKNAVGQFDLAIPGRHNVSNAMAAASAVWASGVQPEDAVLMLADFYGVKRRFQYIGTGDGVVLYDDYAHHPTEVQSTLEAARQFLQRPLIAIFQPHRYTRTQQMGHLFGPSFAAADRIIITELYSAFETPIEGISGRIVYDAVVAALPDKEVHFVATLDDAQKLALELAQPGDTILTMGAGDISTLPSKLLGGLNDRTTTTASLAVENEPLARHTTMKIGGPAQYWAEPNTEAELTATLQWARESGLPLQVLGAGSNLLASDEGYPGIVLKLGRGFDWQRVEGERVIAGGGTLLPKLTKFALENQLGNMEWACGVPGTVGGSIWGNAGARGFNGEEFEGRDAAADLESIVAFDRQGVRYVLQRDDIEFKYRRSSLGELIVTEATFVLKPLTEEQARRHRQAVKDLLKRRRETQPANAASSGCMWKNPDLPDCGGAGALIEDLGLKGHSVGGAQVSEIHANFIVNTGNATSADVEALMRVVEEKAERVAGVKLEREVRFLG